MRKGLQKYRTAGQFGFGLHFNLPLARFRLLFKIIVVVLLISRLRSEKEEYQSLTQKHSVAEKIQGLLKDL